MKQNAVSYVLKLAVILLLITAVTAAALGLTNYITEDRIAELQEEKTAQAMAAILPADSYTPVEGFADDTGLVQALYQADDQGFVAQVAVSGSQNTIELMVGVDQTGTVTGISIIKQSETAGLGAVAAASSAKGEAFRSQFKGMSGQVAVTKDGGQVDALTGATVTSRAICTAVNAAQAAAAPYLQ